MRSTFIRVFEIVLAVVAAVLFITVAVTAKADQFVHLDMKSTAVLTEGQKLTLVQRGLDFFQGCMEAINNESKCGDLAEKYVSNLKKLTK